MRFSRMAFTGLAWLVTLCCAVRAQEKVAEKHAVTVGKLERHYLLHVPRTLPKNRPVPLVLMFHGGGGTPRFAQRESKFNDIADREGFLVAYPEGIGKSWNDGRKVEAIEAQRDNIDDLGFVAALIDDVNKTHRVDAKRVYATGISNGGIFSHYLAANLSSRIAAIAPVVGGLAEPFEEKFKPEKPVSVLILQGTKDPLVPFHGGYVAVVGAKRGKIVATEQAAKKWVESNGCQREPIKDELPDKDPKDGCTVTRLRYPQGKDGSEVIVYRIEGGGHTWPNGLQYLPEKVIGKVCRDFDGSEVIWQFFKSHPRP